MKVLDPFFPSTGFLRRTSTESDDVNNNNTSCHSQNSFFEFSSSSFANTFPPNPFPTSILNVVRYRSQGLVGAPACGDVMKLQIKVDDNGVITESKFKTFGCGSAIASSSVATEWVKGKAVDDVLAIKNADIAAHLKLPPVKLHCSMLAEDAIKAAVQDWKSKQSGKEQAA